MIFLARNLHSVHGFSRQVWWNQRVHETSSQVSVFDDLHRWLVASRSPPAFLGFVGYFAVAILQIPTATIRCEIMSKTKRGNYLDTFENDDVWIGAKKTTLKNMLFSGPMLVCRHTSASISIDGIQYIPINSHKVYQKPSALNSACPGKLGLLPERFACRGSASNHHFFQPPTACTRPGFWLEDKAQLGWKGWFAHDVCT